MLISIEGIDGSGKTTMAAFLQDYMRGCHDIKSIVTSEFNFSPAAIEMKSQLAGCESVAEQYKIVMRLRMQHHREIVLPALEGGLTVIIDRYLHSTMAYQGEDEEMMMDYYVDHAVRDLPFPDLTFFLDVTPEQAAKRLTKRLKSDRMDSKGLDYFRKVSEGFQQACLCLANKTRHIKIPAGKPEADTRARIANCFTRDHLLRAL